MEKEHWLQILDHEEELEEEPMHLKLGEVLKLEQEQVQELELEQVQELELERSAA